VKTMADPNDTAAADERARKARADKAAAQAVTATAGAKDVDDKAREVREAQEAEATALTAGEIPPDPSQEMADAIKLGTVDLVAGPTAKRDTKADDQRAGYRTR